MVTNQLVKKGLGVSVTEEEPEWIGPVLTKKEASDPKLLSGLAQAMTTGESPISFQGVTLSNGAISDSQFRLASQLQKRRHYASGPKTYPLTIGNLITKNQKNELFQPIQLEFPPRRPIPIPRGMYCDVAKQSDKSSASKRSVPQKSSLTLRSVEQIFLFLGQLIRTELGLNDGILKDLRDLDGNPTKGVSSYFFKVEPRVPLNGEFHGTIYTVAADPSGADASSQVLTNLLALQSSAKSLPAPNVIAIAP
jgi:hypothetical protein